MKMDKKYLLLKGFTLIVFAMLTFLFCNLKAYAIEDTTWQNDYDFGVYETYDYRNVIVDRYIIISHFLGEGDSYDIIIPSKAVIGGNEYRTTITAYTYNDFLPKDNVLSFSVEDGVCYLGTDIDSLFNLGGTRSRNREKLKKLI